MIDLAVFLKKNGYKPDQVQDFIPAPFDIATCMYHTGLDPFTGEEVYIAKHLRDRKMQRALLQFFKPENYFEVRKALLAAGRSELIGSGCDCLIPDQPPKAAIEARTTAGRRSCKRRVCPSRFPAPVREVEMAIDPVAKLPAASKRERVAAEFMVCVRPGDIRRVWWL